jgi:hypothetical protein
MDEEQKYRSGHDRHGKQVGEMYEEKPPLSIDLTLS